jgi:protein-L-isoaspartate O-methyltransferase
LDIAHEEPLMTKKAADTLATYVAEYRESANEADSEIERQVLGSDFGSTGYTTCSQADLLLTALRLRPEDRLLDLGAGRGWPGLYIAGRSGCRVISTDLPVAGLSQARSRARREGLHASSSQAVSDGSRLPFPPATFDAIVHADVLC